MEHFVGNYAKVFMGSKFCLAKFVFLCVFFNRFPFVAVSIGFVVNKKVCCKFVPGKMHLSLSEDAYPCPPPIVGCLHVQSTQLRYFEMSYRSVKMILLFPVNQS